MSSSLSDWFEIVSGHIASEKFFAVATVVRDDAHLGAKLLIYPDGTFLGNWDNPELTQRVIADAIQFLEQERAQTCTYDGVQVFIET